MADGRTLQDYMEELATHFRLRMRDRGTELKSNARTHFSPEGPGKKRNNNVLYQTDGADIADFEQKLRASKENNRCLDSVKFFVDEPAAKKVRLDRQLGHMCVCLDGRPGLVIDKHADCDPPSEQLQSAPKGRCALCSAPSCRYGCSVCRVRLCVVLRDDDTRRSCAEIWHDPDCDLKSVKRALRRKISGQQKHTGSQESTDSWAGEVSYSDDDGTGQQRCETAHPRRITISETPIQRNENRRSNKKA
jgi:hypothetical protein